MTIIEGKSAAILCLLHVLRDHSSPERPLTNNEVIKYLEQEYGISITPNTIRAHVATLTMLGYEISTFEQNSKGLYLEPREPEYADDEIRVLIDSVLTSRYIPEHQARDLIKKLTRMASKDFPRQLSYIHPINQWNHQRNKEFFWSLSRLAEAVDKGKQAEFQYNTIGPDGELRPKGRLARVHPYALVCANGQYYLLCSLGRYNDLRHYRVDRMTGVEMRDKPARTITTIPGYEKGLDLARYTATHHFMYGGQVASIALRMPAERAGDVLDAFGQQARIQDLGDGRIEVSLSATEEGMRYFALQFGANGCEVLSPPSLRDQLREDIKSLAELYGV